MADWIDRIMESGRITDKAAALGCMALLVYKARQSPQPEFSVSLRKLAEQIGRSVYQTRTFLQSFENESVLEQMHKQRETTLKVLTAESYKSTERPFQTADLPDVKQSLRKDACTEGACESAHVSTRGDIIINKRNPTNNKKSPSARNGKRITYNWDTCRFEGIDDGKITRWQTAYPAVDIRLEINRAASWQEENPTKRKSNYGRFLVNWFCRVQDRGGTAGRSAPAVSGDPKRDPMRGWNKDDLPDANGKYNDNINF